jgi:hemolysin activation/secretion protein
MRHKITAARATGLAFLCLLAMPGIAASQDASEPPAEAAKFAVLEYRVLGNKVLPQIEVERAVYPHLGEDKTLQDVESARAALELAYRSAGYGTVLVDIPEQSVDRGIVRLKVTEGRLDRVRVQGARYVSARRIKERLPAAQSGEVPSFPELQDQLAQYNQETRDRSVVPVLGAGRTPGTVDLTLRVEDRFPAHASLEVNNQYTADTSKLRLLGSVSYDNLFDRLDSISLQYQTAPQERKEVDVLAASYAMRIGPHGETLSFYGVKSDSDVAALGTLSVLGAGKVFGTRLSLPFLSSAEGYQGLTAGIDYKDFKERIQVDPETMVETPIRYSNLSLGHTGIWRGSSSTFSLNSTLNFGLRGVGGSSQEFADKGLKARPNYFSLRSDAVLDTPFFFKGWGLQTRLAGQYAVDPVISNEQFAVGGADSVRGYLEAEAISDTGVRGTLQVMAPSWRFGSDVLQMRAFAFFDAARVIAIEPLPDEPRHTDLRSVGVGINTNVLRIVDGSFVWAYPLVSGSRTEAHDSRLLFSVRASW